MAPPAKNYPPKIARTGFLVSWAVLSHRNNFSYAWDGNPEPCRANAPWGPGSDANAEIHPAESAGWSRVGVPGLPHLTLTSWACYGEKLFWAQCAHWAPEAA